MAVQIQLRNDIAANWTSTNPVLAVGEMGVETDTDQFKLGDGVTAWNSLGYGGIAGQAGVVQGETEPTNQSLMWIDTSEAGSAANLISADTITTQGDLIIGDASGDPSRLAVGAADQVLTSNGTTMSWESPSGGGLVLIQEISAAAQNEIDFAAIPTGYKALQFHFNDFAQFSAQDFYINFNNERGTSATKYQYADSFTYATNLAIDKTEISFASIGPTASNFIIEIQNYAGSGFKSILGYGNTSYYSPSTNVNKLFKWATYTDAISSAQFWTISSNFTLGSAKLYGVM